MKLEGMWAQTNLHECGWGGEGRGRSGGASCPSALKFSPAENEGGEGAKGKERMLGTPVRGNTRESDLGLTIQGPWWLWRS